MSDTDKGVGRGRGKWTAKGAQAADRNDIEALKSLVAEMALRLDALEAGEAGEGTGADEVQPPPGGGAVEPPADNGAGVVVEPPPAEGGAGDTA